MNQLTLGQALAYAEFEPHILARRVQAALPLGLIARQGLDDAGYKRLVRGLSKMAAGASVTTETDAGRKAKREAAWQREIERAGGAVFVGPPSMTVSPEGGD